ncbi:HTH_38 domain-containing protein [Trichonephila clavipes]|nr:HTH_38 domain-containing protein [Trichonephila clavipes]
MASWASYEFERTRGKVIANMERNVSRHHTGLVRYNARWHCILISCYREIDRTILRLRRNRRQYEQLTDFDRGRIIGLREAGWSNRRIGRHLGRSDMVVARCWQQWITEGRVYRRGGSGRPRNTNDREDRAIRRVATSAPTTSLASIQRLLPPSRHPVPSRETIRRRLTEVGLRSRRPLRRLPLIF